jgi:hypothetical protein
VFLAEVLAKGEVPRDARSIWKQRSRWASAAHMYVLDPKSVFWRKQPFMSFWQKSLYWIPLILHFIIIWAEPIMFAMPLMCLVADICPYGMDFLLWVTHFAKLLTTSIISSYADTMELSRAAVYNQAMTRVLFLVNVKAVVHTIMIYLGLKRLGGFKVTKKAGEKNGKQEGSSSDAKALEVQERIAMKTPTDIQAGPRTPVCSLILLLYSADVVVTGDLNTGLSRMPNQTASASES